MAEDPRHLVAVTDPIEAKALELSAISGMSYATAYANIKAIAKALELSAISPPVPSPVVHEMEKELEATKHLLSISEEVNAGYTKDCAVGFALQRDKARADLAALLEAHQTMDTQLIRERDTARAALEDAQAKITAARDLATRIGMDGMVERTWVRNQLFAILKWKNE